MRLTNKKKPFTRDQFQKFKFKSVFFPLSLNINQVCSGYLASLGGMVSGFQDARILGLDDQTGLTLTCFKQIRFRFRFRMIYLI